MSHFSSPYKIQEELSYLLLSFFANPLKNSYILFYPSLVHNGKPRKGCTECKEKIDVALFDPNKVIVSDHKSHPGGSDHYLFSMIVKVVKVFFSTEF